ncbi:MAG: BatA domain-containing protein [Pirellulaceae bacterium]|nr:BatA domain-containing protein [Pirellulaceae bacterium]
MSFLQPWLLWALPLMVLPIVIHFINQWRYQTRLWAPMMFLLQANRLSSGFAKLRQWLILALRTLAIAALILAISRPLSSGFWSLLGGSRADTTLVLMDRSPSMQMQGSGSSESKLASAKRQMADALTTLGSAHWVAIDSASAQAQEYDSLAALMDAPVLTGNSAAANMTQMMYAVLEYLQRNKPGAAEIWIGTDLQSADWNADSGDWAWLRQSFASLPQSVRFRLLAYPDMQSENLSIRVTDARRQAETDSGGVSHNFLVLSVDVFRSGEGAPPARSVPVQLELSGVRSRLQVELSGSGGQLREYRIPLPAGVQSGWGRVELPADANPADNEFFFVFSQSAARRVVLVTDDPAAARPLQIAASISADGVSQTQLEQALPGSLSSSQLEDTALVVWHAALPDEVSAAMLDHYLSQGGQVVFFPPASLVHRTHDPSRAYRDVRWVEWIEHSQLPLAVTNWRGDQDLLAATQSGAGLPVGQLEIRGHATLDSQQEMTQLAALDGGHSLLARLPTSSGGVYFCTASPDVQLSSLAEEGIVLYVVIQRAIEQGQLAVRGLQMRSAGPPTNPAAPIVSDSKETSQAMVASEGDTNQPQSLAQIASKSVAWEQVVGPPALSTEFACHAGIYREGERLLAVNRPLAEDQYTTLPDDKLAALFEGLQMQRVDRQAGSSSSILREIWRLFLIAVVGALLFEAALCIPRRRPDPSGQPAAFPLRS